MHCVKSVSLSFLINGEVCGSVKPSRSRGLRHGDRLSPYLFLICAEGLSRLILDAERKKDLAEFRCNRGVSGTECGPDRVKRWQCKLFSTRGKEVLLKAVIQSVPTYSMSLFRLPQAITDLHIISANFWWGSDDEKRKIHWCCWSKLCHSKDDGGMGFRNLSIFNQALLAKQVWRLHHNPLPLAAKVLKQCYFADSSVMNAGSGSSSSYLWRSFMWRKELLEAGTRWRIGSSDSILIYHDRWIPRPSTFKIISLPVLGNEALVRELKFPSGSWNESLIRESFLPDDSEHSLLLFWTPRLTAMEL
ncbi:hypothetical protein Dsin_016641 [Dipteronia sinensis]|uniref:Reverse transcriptase n=1 Tax=Dipteronia sinensis TaxID=43782 RepID=A0AAE0ADG8_9ROSI|nr:hypothetical protein Dsin_016641 [Dipteronia sinensis]